MPTAFFITHPDVVIDPTAPVPAWHLSARGIARMQTFSREAELAGLRAIWSSGETKAIEAAGILAAASGLGGQVDVRLGENDRSATGFLPPEEFDQVCDALFGHPTKSIRGWERAIDAQARIVQAVEAILKGHSEGDIAFVAHGGVGTLLLCQLLGEQISRARDQPFQGHFFSFDLPGRTILHGWRAFGN